MAKKQNNDNRDLDRFELVEGVVRDKAPYVISVGGKDYDLSTLSLEEQNKLCSMLEKNYSESNIVYGQLFMQRAFNPPKTGIRSTSPSKFLDNFINSYGMGSFGCDVEIAKKTTSKSKILAAEKNLGEQVKTILSDGEIRELSKV